MLAAAALPACGVSVGASLRALYESDVRFEHCMARDARPDVKPTLRRACWEEWLSFYTFGQTRDRIDYARVRAVQLGAASDFDEGDMVAARPAAAAPDPTSAIAPPPLMVEASAGAGDAGLDAAAAAETDERTAAAARCSAECDQGVATCEKTCKATPPCTQACNARRQRCVARCDARRQGSR